MKTAILEKYDKKGPRNALKRVDFLETFAVASDSFCTNTLSLIAKELDVYESFPENKYYTKKFDVGKNSFLILNMGKYLKANFHSVLAWIDNTGIYQRLLNLDCK